MASRFKSGPACICSGLMSSIDFIFDNADQTVFSRRILFEMPIAVHYMAYTVDRMHSQGTVNLQAIDVIMSWPHRLSTGGV